MAWNTAQRQQVLDHWAQPRGGSVLVPDELSGVTVIRPPHFAVANAVGAAIAQVSGEVAPVFSRANLTRQEALSTAESEARCNAILAGAVPETIMITDREDVPLAYLPGNATRIRVKAVGDIGVSSCAH